MFAWSSNKYILLVVLSCPCILQNCNLLLFPFCRELKIRLRRDTELFTDDFVAENADFDPAKVLTGDVEGTV